MSSMNPFTQRHLARSARAGKFFWNRRFARALVPPKPVPVASECEEDTNEDIKYKDELRYLNAALAGEYSYSLQIPAKGDFKSIYIFANNADKTRPTVVELQLICKDDKNIDEMIKILPFAKKGTKILKISTTVADDVVPCIIIRLSDFRKERIIVELMHIGFSQQVINILFSIDCFRKIDKVEEAFYDNVVEFCNAFVVKKDNSEDYEKIFALILEAIRLTKRSLEPYNSDILYTFAEKLYINEIIEYALVVLALVTEENICHPLTTRFTNSINEVRKDRAKGHYAALQAKDISPETWSDFAIYCGNPGINFYDDASMPDQVANNVFQLANSNFANQVHNVILQVNNSVLENKLQEAKLRLDQLKLELDPRTQLKDKKVIIEESNVGDELNKELKLFYKEIEDFNVKAADINLRDEIIVDPIFEKAIKLDALLGEKAQEMWFLLAKKFYDKGIISFALMALEFIAEEGLYWKQAKEMSADLLKIHKEQANQFLDKWAKEQKNTGKAWKDFSIHCGTSVLVFDEASISGPIAFNMIRLAEAHYIIIIKNRVLELINSYLLSAIDAINKQIKELKQNGLVVGQKIATYETAANSTAEPRMSSAELLVAIPTPSPYQFQELAASAASGRPLRFSSASTAADVDSKGQESDRALANKRK